MSRARRPSARLLAAAGLLLAAQPAVAAVDCTASAGGGVAYAVYDPLLTTPTDSTGSVTVTCTFSGSGAVQVSYAVALSPGLGNAFATRRMPYGASQLGYNLYADVARTRVWGDGSVITQWIIHQFVHFHFPTPNFNLDGFRRVGSGRRQFDQIRKLKGRASRAFIRGADPIVPCAGKK